MQITGKSELEINEAVQGYLGEKTGIDFVVHSDINGVDLAINVWLRFMRTMSVLEMGDASDTSLEERLWPIIDVMADDLESVAAQLRAARAGYDARSSVDQR